MAGVIDRLVYQLGIDTNTSEFRRATTSLRSIATATTKLYTTMAKFVTGATAVATVTNSMTMEQENLARSVGVSSDVLRAFAEEGSRLGLNFENVADLAEEMNNKFGESAGLEEITSVTESLQMLGLEFKDLKDLKPDEQFKAITSAALNMKDAQKASSATDILLGGEASKLFGFLVQQGMTYDDLIKKQQKYNMTNDRSKKGAEAHIKAMKNLNRFIGQITKLFSGIFGESLAKILDSISEWIELNKELLKQGITEFAEAFGVALRIVVGVIKTFVNGILWVIDILGGFKNVLKLIGVVLATAFLMNLPAIIGGAILLFGKLRTAVLLLNTAFLANPMVWVAIAIAGVLLALEDLWAWINGNTEGSLLGQLFGDYDTVGTRVTKWFQELGTTISTWRDETGEILSKLFDDSVAYWTEKINGWIVWIKSVFSEMVNSIKGYLSGLFDGIKPPEWMTTIGGSISDAVVGAFDSVVDFAGFGDTPTPQPVTVSVDSRTPTPQTITAPVDSRTPTPQTITAPVDSRTPTPQTITAPTAGNMYRTDQNITTNTTENFNVKVDINAKSQNDLTASIGNAVNENLTRSIQNVKKA